MLRWTVILLSCGLVAGGAVWLISEPPAKSEGFQQSGRPAQKSGSREPGQEPDSANEYAPQTVLAFPMRALTDVKTVKAKESSLADNELVLGCVVNGEAKAWAINQLTGPHREIINDELGGRAIAATW